MPRASHEIVAATARGTAVRHRQMPRLPRASCPPGCTRVVPPARRVEPELLDSLAEEAPASRASRRDLRRINRLLGTAGWCARVLGARRRPGEGTLEIGAGGGELAPCLMGDDVLLAGLDRSRRPANWPESALWFQTDVLQFAGWAGFPVVVANLFLHHFERRDLAALGHQLGRHARLIVVSEPLRVQRTRRLFDLVCPLLRAHAVTRHDGRVSIAAGFRGAELPGLLALDPQLWRWETAETWTGSSRLIAERRR